MRKFDEIVQESLNFWFEEGVRVLHRHVQDEAAIQFLLEKALSYLYRFFHDPVSSSVTRMHRQSLYGRYCTSHCVSSFLS